MNRRIIPIILSFMTMTATSATAQTKVDERRTVAADEVIELSNVAGTVSIVGTTTGELHVTGTIDPQHKLEITQKDHKTRVEIICPNRSSTNGAYLVVHLPRGARVKTSTVSADVDITGVVGTTEITTVSGTLNVPERTGAIRLVTVSGDIVVKGETTTLAVETVSGDITVTDAAGNITGKTVSGKMEVEGKQVNEATFQSISGDLILAAELAPNGRLNVSAHSGEIRIALPSTTAAEFHLTTLSGEIVTNFSGADARKSGRRIIGESLDFITGSGGAWVNVESFSGDIRITKK